MDQKVNMKMPTIIENAKAQIEERRAKIKTRIDEWKERGWRPAEGFLPQTIVKDIRERGLISTFKARREARLQRRGKEPIEPAFPEDMLVKKEKEIVRTVGKREIAIEL